MSELGWSEIIAIVGVIVDAGIAIWIVKTIQKKLTDRRILKDLFINEIKEIREEYKSFLSNLYAGKIVPKDVAPWFKLMNIKINDILGLMSKKIKVDKEKLKPYQVTLREMITEDPDFINGFKDNKPIQFSNKNQFIKFQQENNQLFNELIVEINDAK